MALCAGLAWWSPAAHGAAQVSRLNLVLSVNPTQIQPDDFNHDIIDPINRQLEAFGLEGIEKMSFAWLYDAQLRYFVRPNFAVEAGVGHMRTTTSREFLPALNTAIQFSGTLISVPAHVGAAYYLPPYTQGDFQARLYLGGGMTSLVNNRARFVAVTSGVDSATAAQANFRLNAKGDSPGYYLETGFHLFFASRFSVMLGGMYRGALIRRMFLVRESRTPTGDLVRFETYPAFDLDMSGVGGRFGVAIGF